MNARELLEADHSELDGLFDKVFTAVAAADRDRTFKTLDLFWARLAMHIRAEHLCLFPAIRNDKTAELLDQLRHDHDFFMTELARAVKALRLTYHFGNEPETLDIVRAIIHAVRELLVEHNAVEEEVIYPTAGNEDALAAGVKKELDNLPARFR